MFYDTGHLFRGEATYAGVVAQGGYFLVEDAMMIDPAAEVHVGAAVGKMGVV